MDQSGGQAPPPPPAQEPAPPPPPPQQGWQSTPTPPGPPPAGGGQAGTPSWTNNLQNRSTLPGPGGVALADAITRFIALVIDFVIIGILGIVVNAVTTSVMGDTLFGGIFGVAVKAQSFLGALVTVLVMLVATGAYFVLLWTRMNGQTLGMRVMKIAVRDEATGGPISMNQAIMRWVFLAAPWAINFFYGWGLGLIISILVLVYYIYLIYSIGNDPLRQGLHDKQAKTVVAKLAA